MNRNKKELTDIQYTRCSDTIFQGTRLSIMIPKSAMINVKKHVFTDKQNVETLNNNRAQVIRISEGVKREHLRLVTVHKIDI